MLIEDHAKASTLLTQIAALEQGINATRRGSGTIELNGSRLTSIPNQVRERIFRQIRFELEMQAQIYKAEFDKL